ncbi:hypothetical protein GLOIN_2v1881038 [Rhizophagus clarus]|uniref:Ion transport domain-containing protein n=1 Tax=Rhizophagus clarus TaxID=94130 RepID=A0A8H3MGI3_9GLOM|nr:hypothetical protein GLOIN_2v1881038 [Rhizophagus clarus]
MDDYKIDMLDAKSENVKEEIEETKANIEEIETHRKNIDKKQTIFSQDVKYAVTYSKQDNSNSLLTWSINTESVGEQQYDQYLELEQKGYNEFSLDLIHKKIVLFHYKENGKIKYELVDLTERKFLDLRETLQIPEEFPIIKYSIGFFSDDFNNSNDSNDRLILVSLYSSKSGKKDYKIYEYSFKDKQITTYDIVIPKGLEDHNVNCCINETKLFFFACDMTDETRNYLILQWDLSDLSAMTFEMQYHLLEDKEMPLIMFKEIRLDINGPNFVMNEGKTLLAIRVYNRIYIFSMESGLQVSTLKFKESDFTMESFVSSNDVPEGLIVSFGDNALFLDPFDPFSDVIEIDYTGKNSKITNKGKKISTIENSVHVTNELKKNLSRKILENNHYYSNLYTLSIFQTIRNLFEEILKGKIKSDCSDLKMITIQGRFYFVSYEDEKVEIWGRTSSKNEDILTQFPATFKFGGLFAFKLLNNSDLVLITDAGIHIYTIISASIALRYFWVNEDWKNNFQRESTIIKILENEFKESRSSLPPPTFETLIRSPDDDQHSSLDDFLVLNPDYEGHYKYKELLISIICLNTIELSKFGKEMLKISIEKKNDVIVGTIIDRIIEIIQNNSSDPSSNEENSGNSSSIEESFGNPTSIEKNSSDPSSNEKNTSDPSSNEKNSGNSSSIEESSGNPASIEKSTSDPSSNEKNSASTLESNLIPDVYRTILLIISVILGLIHILVEIWQFYWLKENYFKDPCNFFDLGAYLLPIITSLHWIIKETPPLWIIAFSNLFLSLKFLLFFRVFHHFGIYFTIIVGVAKKISPFLIVLFIVIFGFSHTFYILLRPTQDFSFDNPTFNNDKNNPWNLATKYNLVNPDGTINPNATMIQPPDSNTNLFDWFPTSLLAMYLFITGNNGSLSPWDYRDYQAMTVLLEYLIQKAKIIVETEIFYMLHYKKYQKQNLDWIYYNIPINNVRKLIEAIKDHKIEFDAPPYIRNELKKLMKFRESKESFKEILKQKSRYKTLRETYKMNVQRGWLIDLIRDPPVNHKIN